jgi:hypothetical protein
MSRDSRFVALAKCRVAAFYGWDRLAMVLGFGESLFGY